jgi:hypothetical protein
LNGWSFVAHVLLTHVSVGAQTTPHIPQLFGSFVVSTQPDGQHDCAPVHAGPLLHVFGCLHALFTQVSPGGHGIAQPPQLAGSLVVSAQPVEQHWSPPVQAPPPLQPWPILQVLLMHCMPIVQTTPHMPQLFGSVRVSLQPFMQHFSPPVQPIPPWHVFSHMLLMQAWFAPHVVPQPPQLFGSLVSSTQPSVPQHFWLPVQPFTWHAGTHALFWQTRPMPHAWPQPPQLASSLVVSISQPSLIIMLQSAKPASHEPILHMLAAHAAVPCAIIGHTLSQLPQLFGSLTVFLHCAMSQHDRPPMQTPPSPQPPTQMPPEHVSPGLHGLLQPPQFSGSVAKFDSQPSVSTWLQSPKPMAHAPISHFDAAHVIEA